MKHTQEPWAVACTTSVTSEDVSFYGKSQKHGNPIWIGRVYGNGILSRETEDRNANASRIVACVNACAGIEDPAAELARLRRVEGAARAAEAIGRNHSEGLTTSTIPAICAILRSALEG